jgi:hypothetical protein
VIEDRGAPDADVGRDVVEPRRLVAALGEVALRGGDDLGAGLEPAVAAGDRSGWGGSRHGLVTYWRASELGNPTPIGWVRWRLHGADPGPVHEIVLQPRGRAGDRQAPGAPRVGYTRLYGAPGRIAGVSILAL